MAERFCADCGEEVTLDEMGNCPNCGVYLQNTDKYYFNISETDKHDEELEIIEANSLEVAKKEFAERHPEDVKNIYAITLEDSIVNLL